MKRITTATVRKIAREKGISISMVSVACRAGNVDLDMVDLPKDMIDRNLRSAGRGNTTEVDRVIRKYNRQVRKIVAALRGIGMFFWGRCGGTGVWYYTSQQRTASDELVFNNID